MVTALRTDLADRGMTHVTTLVGDLENLDLPDACADAVTASMVLFFLPDLRAGLRETAGVLKAGGTFAFTVFGNADPRWAPVYEAFNPHLPHGHRLENSRPVHPDLADTEGILDARQRRVRGHPLCRGGAPSPFRRRRAVAHVELVGGTERVMAADS
jgi:SAM-dependent methyltransferase